MYKKKMKTKEESPHLERYCADKKRKSEIFSSGNFGVQLKKDLNLRFTDDERLDEEEEVTYNVSDNEDTFLKPFNVE